MARKLIVEVVADTSQLQNGFKRAQRHTRGFQRDLDRTTRGAIAASGAFRSLGRSVAFASSAFLGGAGFVAAITSTIKAAEEHQRVISQTRVAVERSGLSWAKYRQEIEGVSEATSKLSGFDDEKLLETFSMLVRRTGSVTRALELNALAADVARGRNIELERAAGLVLKASIGNVGALRRLGINIGKNATATQALALLQRRYSGAAEAYGKTAAGATDRFRVALENMQEAIGTQLLPTITTYLNRAADWLNNSENQKRVVDDVRTAVQAIIGVLRTLKGVFDRLNEVTGSLKNTLKLLLIAFLAFKTAKIAANIAEMATSFGLIGTRAAGATGRVNVLAGALAALPAQVKIAVVVTVVGTAALTKFLGWARKGLPGQPGEAGGAAPKPLDPSTWTRDQLAAFAAQHGTKTAEYYYNHPDEAMALARRVLKARGMGAYRTPLAPGIVPRAPGAAGGAYVPRPYEPLGPVAGKGPSATLRNQWFDAMIGRQLGRVQDIPSLKKQIERLRQIKALVDARIKATKDVTRRLNLEDQSLEIQRQIIADQGQIADANKQAAQDALQKRTAMLDAMIAGLELNVEKAGATAAVADDIAALRKLEAGIRKRMAIEGRTTDLLRQEFETQQQIAEAQRQQRLQRQYTILGLGPTGEARLPGLQALRRQWQRVSESIKGTPLDTRSNRSLLQRIRKALDLKSLEPEVRQRIRELLSGISDELKQGTDKILATAKPIRPAQFIKALGLDLTPQEYRKLFAGLSRVGAGGTVPGGVTPAFAGAGAVVVHGDVNVHGVQDPGGFADAVHKRAKARPPSRRGAR